MSQDFGIESRRSHAASAHRAPARYLVIIDTAGASLARLFLENRAPAGEFDAATEEVAVMTRGLTPARSAADPAWDQALAGHSAQERSTAEVYTLDV